jgi:hypothetical protein
MMEYAVYFTIIMSRQAEFCGVLRTSALGKYLLDLEVAVDVLVLSGLADSRSSAHRRVN